jgi:hypothetical protein
VLDRENPAALVEIRDEHRRPPVFLRWAKATLALQGARKTYAANPPFLGFLGETARFTEIILDLKAQTLQTRLYAALQARFSDDLADCDGLVDVVLKSIFAQTATK